MSNEINYITFMREIVLEVEEPVYMGDWIHNISLQKILSLYNILFYIIKLYKRFVPNSSPLNKKKKNIMYNH